jgi:hypothetical protein
MTDEMPPLDNETQSLLDMPRKRREEMDYEARVCGTPELIHINEQSIKADFNRCISEKFLDQAADPEGVHVVAPMMIHEHKMGVKVDPHLRCWVYIKVKDKMEPEQAILDLPFDTFRTLITAKRAMEFRNQERATADSEHRRRASSADD